jgi:hypothetical protein
VSSERLFSTVSYALFIAPGAVVVMWILWRVAVWCRFHTARLVARVGGSPAAKNYDFPRLFARNTSRAISYFFIFFLALPLLVVPLRYLADRLEGPQIGVLHWLLVVGPLPVLIAWLVALIRRKEDWRRGL